MLQNEVSKEQIEHFAEKLQSLYKYDNEVDRNLIKKGLVLYRQGSVYNVNLVGNEIVGRVQDVTPVDVTLDLDFLEMSSCTCPTGGFCRHQFAVFFSAISTSGIGVGKLLDEWKSGGVNKKLTLADIPVMRARDLKPFEEASLESWAAFFDSEYKKFVGDRSESDYYFISSIYHRYFSTLKSKAPSGTQHRRLFIIYAGITSIQKIIEILPKLKLTNYQFDSTVKPYVQNFVDAVIDNAYELQAVTFSFSLEPLLEEMQEKIRDGLLENTWFQYERFHLYRMLWSTIFNRKNWVERETEVILQMKEENGWSGGMAMALAHLSFLSKRDQEAIEYLELLDTPAIYYTFWWMNELSEEQQWGRLQLWLNYADKHFETFIQGLHSYESRRHMTRTFLKMITDYASEYDESLYLNMMKKLMPYSYIEFTTYLFEEKNYHGWVELQLAVGYEIEDHDKYILKIIEDTDRAALLPLYHQAVSKALKQKNRPSYKRAIRYLRKLRSYYRKLKQEEAWDDYITKLSAKTKRLRAFQEELLNAKFISS
ncbi:SWIM zinc finger family protein [Bacillus luteolus]|uniref:SWIM zinc finger family protein n=1 Tax=Litchfieldia luteola TaxID=682179 RepID=A0ABR9QFK2_9BACI|nr:SWIM zinc finger family protein [Cytobacillus luteolus]MBE4907268.1 SWIM zinc finger family protein [Cytobacillus luteolus]MBP1943252.1 flagellar biosynthesis chaperone FliJ [Cytobacillus luteolus]